MSATINRVTILGNLLADPRLDKTTSGTAVCNFTICTNNDWTDGAGVKVEKTERHRVVVWGSKATLCAENLMKGSRCFVEGRLETTNRLDGDKKVYNTQVVANKVIWLDVIENITDDGAIPA
jgi:single-strand DNA-binding protein